MAELDYKNGYKDALAIIKKEIDEIMTEKERYLKRFSGNGCESNVEIVNHNIMVGLCMAKDIIEEKENEI